MPVIFHSEDYKLSLDPETLDPEMKDEGGVYQLLRHYVAEHFKNGLDVWRDIEKKNLPLAAAGATYYLLLSFFPALTVLSAVMSYFPIENGLGDATAILGSVIPPQVNTLIEELMTGITPHRVAFLSFGLAAMLWLASVAFKGLILGLDMAHGSTVQRPIWVSRILALLLTIAVGALLLIGVIVTSVGPGLRALLAELTPTEPLWLRLEPYLKWTISALVLFTAIELLYVLGPSLPVSKRRTVPGAAVATVMWLVLAWGLGFYFHHFGELKFARLFGFLAAPALLMTWLYCSAITILLGAEINSRLGITPKTATLGTTPHTTMDMHTTPDD